MFLYYQKQNNLLCDIFKPVHSVTEVITAIGSCICDNLHYSVIVFALFLMFLTIFMRNDKTL